MKHRTAILAIALSAALFSTSGLLIKTISVGPLTLVGTRSLLAAGVIAIWMGKPRFAWSLPQLGGAVTLVATQILFVIATRQTSAANAIFLQFTAPIWVAFLGAWFLKETVRPIDWWTMAAVAAGLYLFFSDEFTTEGMWGNINALLSSVTFAWFYLFLRKQKDGSTYETIFLGNILAAIIGIPFLFMEPAWPSLNDWLGLLFMGVLQLGVPFVLLSMAIKHLPAVEAILIQSLEPILNPIWVFLAIGETPTRPSLLGGLVVLTSVTLRAIVGARKPLRPTSPPIPAKEPID